jgi:hypothetical protein
MARLSPRDFGQALDFLREAEGVGGPDPFPSRLLNGLRELVGCDSVYYCELDQHLLAAAAPAPGLRQDCTCDFTARKLSDFVTRTQLHALEIYVEFFRPFDVEYELDVGLPAPPTDTKVFLFSRQSRDFTERERLLLDLLRPHFVSLYAAARNRRVLAALQAHEDSARLVMLGRNGAVDFAGPSARQLLGRYFDTDSDRYLPEVVQQWLREEGARLNRDAALPREGPAANGRPRRSPLGRATRRRRAAPTGRTCEPDPTRAGDPGLGRRGTCERRDRGTTVAQHRDRADSPAAHL